MKSFKRIGAAVLTAALIMSLAACGSKKETEKATEAEETLPETEAETDNKSEAESIDVSGIWEAKDDHVASMYITPLGENEYNIYVSWADGADVMYTWDVSAVLDSATGKFTTEGDGVFTKIGVDETDSWTLTDDSFDIQYVEGEPAVINVKLNNGAEIYMEFECSFEHYEEPEAEDGTGDLFMGDYADSFSQRATMTIAKSGKQEMYNVAIVWSETATERTEWIFTCTYDEKSNKLVCEKNGRCITITGDETETVYEYEDAELYFNEDEKICISDCDGALKDCVFESIK